MSKKKRLRIREASGGFAPGSASVSDTGTGEKKVPGVKVLGLVSRNGRRYLDEAVKVACPLYEGVPVRIDHPEDGQSYRPFVSRFGTIRGAKFKSGEGVVGDLHYNAAHPLAPLFESWLRINPEGIGFSHVAEGEAEHRDGEDVVTAIHRVESVDLVDSPATTTTLFESKMNDEYDDDKKLDEADNDPLADLGAGGDEGGGGGSSADDHLANAVTAIVKDTSLDLAAKKKKILKVLAVLDTGEVEEAEEEEKPGEGEEKVEESEDEDEKKDDKKESLLFRVKSLEAKLEAYELKEKKVRTESEVKALCKAEGLAESLTTPTFLSLLAECGCQKKRKELIADRKAIASESKKPKSHGFKKTEENPLTVDDLLKEAEAHG